MFFGARGARTDRVRMDNAKAPTSDGKTLSSKAVLTEQDDMKSPCAVNLHNAVTLSQQRLGKRVAQLSSARMNEVCTGSALLSGLRFRLVIGNVPSVLEFAPRVFQLVDFRCGGQ